ncbi:MAG: hypothetical protein QM734_08845 [Cyclobacteriaceae bacterium]
MKLRIALVFSIIVIFSQCQKEQMKENGNQTPDIYVGGATLSNGNIEAAYWKNGEVTVLTSTSQDSIEYGMLKTYGNYINTVSVLNGSIYAGGAEVVNGFSVAKIWKDGVAIIE